MSNTDVLVDIIESEDLNESAEAASVPILTDAGVTSHHSVVDDPGTLPPPITLTSTLVLRVYAPPMQTTSFHHLRATYT